MLLSPEGSAEYAFLTKSVLATTMPSGPAAARSPLLDATVNKEDVGAGRESVAQDVGSNRIRESPAMDRKPTS
jgi:hypothetical protein